MDAAAIAEAMPDLAKLALVGVGIDTPMVDVDKAAPLLGATLQHFVDIGLAVAVADDRLRTYRLTPLGQDVFDIVQRRSPRDGTLTANDNHVEPLDAA